MTEGEPRLTVLEQMNRMLAEKEKGFREKEEQLEERFQKLKEFEAQLLKKGEELKIQMEQIAGEKERLEKRSGELEVFAKTLEESMQQVMEEKLALETVPKKDFSMEWENDKLDELASELGLKPAGETQDAETVPAMYRKMQKLVKKQHPKWSILEITKEHLCIEAGDKEIRVFEGNPVSSVQIVQFVKNAKSNKQLSTKIVGLSRTVPEWSIKCEDNQMVCTYQFSKAVDEENVLGKVHDFITTHL